MSLAVAEEPRVVHALPGRVRVHLPGWEGEGLRGLEGRLRRVQGVSGVRSSALTRNVLVRFDPESTDEERILAAVREVVPDEDEGLEEEPESPPAQRERRGPAGRARIAVRGLDRDPDLARRVVERLESWPSVRASASQLTGRALVEFDENRVQLEDLISIVSGLELPELPGENRPTHPLDEGPILQSGARTAGALLGLGLLVTRRLLGRTGSPVAATVPATISGVIRLLDGFPATRRMMHRLFGESAADLVSNTTSIALATLSGSTLGLAVAGAGALRLFTEERARREAWRHYEERVEAATPARPGAVIRLEPGERVPLTARVLEGAGTATGREGLPLPVFPGGEVEPGSRLHGGPFALELLADGPFVPEPRPEPADETLRDRYVRALGPISLGYAVVTGLLTRSLSRAFTGLLLVNPRTAEIGKQFADIGADARVLRAGVTVVGTRPERDVCLPDVLLLDGPRLLTNGLEVSAVLPQGDAMATSEILTLAAGIAGAAGSPWGKAFPSAEGVLATDGTFNGQSATAEIGGKRYFLGPVTHPTSIPAASRPRESGNYLLALRGEGRLLGVLALRPRLAEGVGELVGVCERYGVELALVCGGDRAAAASVARRAGVRLLPDEDTMEAVREQQSSGGVVALISDNARAAAAFAACDLGIGFTTGRSSNFPARADLLAPDLGAVAAIVEAGARRDAAVRDSVLLSILANVFGAAEALVPRCDRVRRHRGERPLSVAARQELFSHAERLAERGLRVLMVAEGPAGTPVGDPGGLVALGFLGISDPLRPGVFGAVRRCHEAGVRVVMLTGDHPATARAIAREAGLPLDANGALLSGEEMAELDNGELDERLEHATVISRITPLDKLRIVESLQRRGHVVAMTGDGVNDAPALRLADVGVAMGRGGTEVARQASDVVVADDDFSTLVETLVEGRSFWRNIRRSLGLLLGGNLGELGLMVGASALSPAVPLNSRQILAVNLVSDVLPALSVALQRPKHRNLAGLDREGEAALEKPLRNDVLRRGIATATPSLAAYLAALGTFGMPAAGSVAFASIVATQLAQTLALGRNANGFNRSVLGAVFGSTGLLVAALTLGPLRAFLNLTPPTFPGWVLIGAAALSAVPLNRLLSAPGLLGYEPNHASQTGGPARSSQGRASPASS